MKLTLKNIGKIKNAVVELNGITVIAGENNTGKSTVGKVLYSIFNSFYKIEDQINRERIENIERTLDMLYRDVTNRMTSRVDTEEIANKILENAEKYKDSDILKQDILDAIAQYDENFRKHIVNKNSLGEELNRISEIISISDEEIFKLVLSKKLDAEFNGQINNIYTESKGYIELKIKNESVSVSVIDNTIQSISDKFHLNTEVIYIDDPFVLDEQRFIPFMSRYGSSLDHRNHLKFKLFFKSSENNIINQIITSNKLDNIYSKINTICSGEIVRGKRANYGYKKSGTDKILDIKNISTGLKTFVILKTLLQNGSLEENGTIVLDEPEIHLHPEWQLLFAELIVLIQKEFNMHILLNTHSPYFLNAIEVYAAKYQIADKCKYYMACINGDTSSIEDVSNSIEKIYLTLARPLQNLENERYNNED